MTYAPKPGTGWFTHRNGKSYGLMLAGDVDGPALFVGIEDGDRFVIAYAPSGDDFQLPMPEHLRRVEIDFGVQAWSVKGVFDSGLLLQAVKAQ